MIMRMETRVWSPGTSETLWNTERLREFLYCPVKSIKWMTVAMILNQNCLFLKKNTFKVSSFRSIFETVHSRWYPFNSVFLRVIPQDSFWYIFCFGRRDIFCLRLSEENYPKVNLVPDVPDISILCRRTEEVPRTSIKSEFLPRKKKTLLCCGRNSISYQSRYHIQIKN